MRRFLGMIVSLGVAGVVLIPTSARAQAQKAEEPANTKTAGALSPRDREWAGLLANANLQSRPFFLAEYHFIRNVCVLTPEQGRAFAREAERAYQATIRELAEKRRKMKAIPPEDVLQVRRRFRDMLAKVAKNHLTAEQVKRLEIDAEKRSAMLRETGIETLLDMIDQELILTDHQRDEIRRSLDSHWRETWFPDPALFLVGKRLLPMIPDDCVAKSLTEDQRKAWRLIPKAQGYSMASMFTISFLRDGILEDDDLRLTQVELRTRNAARYEEAPK